MTTPPACAPPASAPASTLPERLISHLVAAVVTLTVFAPLVRPGYVLRYDLVFVPKQPLRWDLIAPTSSLPRAVPQDLVVSLANLAVPGWLLQRAVLAGASYLAVYGAWRLVPATTRRLAGAGLARSTRELPSGVLTRVVAAVAYGWTPFFAERLLLGQWGLLLAYAALPWLVAAARGVRAGESRLPQLLLAAGVSAITPTGGLIAAGVTFALTIRPGSWRSLLPTALVVGLNAPWLAAAAVAGSGGRSDPAGVAAFAVRAENWSGPIGAIAGTGGIWNAQTTPLSRSSAVVPVVTVALVALAAVGTRELWRRWGADAIRLAAVAGAGIGLALAGALPGTSAGIAWLVRTVPGAGILRDGQKFLLPYALALALGLALGVQRLAARLARPTGRVVLVAAVVLPVAVLPDLAWGAGGALRPVRYPADWDAVAAIVASHPGEVLALPFAEYRSYQWNNGQIVIDPAPRYLPSEVLTDDTLYVGATTVAGESSRAAGVRRLLAGGGSAVGAGTRWVLVDRAAAQATSSTALVGLVAVYTGPDLALYANPGAAASGPATGPVVAARFVVVAANAVAAGLLVAAGVALGAGHLPAIAVRLGAVWRLRRKPTPW